MTSKFIEWVEKNKKIQKLSEEMKNYLLECLADKIIDTKENCEKNMIEKWGETLGNSDNLSFEEDEEVYTYVKECYLLFMICLVEKCWL